MSSYSPNVSYDWKNSELAKLKTDDQKCTIYFPQILRWMFEQKGRFCFQVKGPQIESINNVLDVCKLTGMTTNTWDVELKVDCSISTTMEPESGVVIHIRTSKHEDNRFPAG